jgi:predicted component of viral defense system (DUF524 family)
MIESGTQSNQRAKQDDLQKMHTYRDAIAGVKASVVLYPGNVATLRSPNREKLDVDLKRLLEGTVEGIGAIPMSPLDIELDRE